MQVRHSRRWLLAALAVMSLGAGGFAYAAATGPSSAADGTTEVVCPLTGKTIPCPGCCPAGR